MFRFFKKKPQTATLPASNVPDESGGVLAHDAPPQTHAETEVLQAIVAEPLPALPIDLIEPVVDVPQPIVEASSASTDETAKPATSWMARLAKSMSRTGKQIGVIFGHSTIDDALYDDLESALIMADAGPQASQQLIKALKKRVRSELIDTPSDAKKALCDVLTEHLKVLEKPFDIGAVKPLVVMMAGVNGAGKTTSIGKLAYTLQKQGAKVLLAAGDTFRAAAREQLIEWGARNNIAVIAQTGGDPAAVAFDAVHAGRARDVDVVMIDTAGRLPTQLNLMDELKKIKRVVSKADGTAPHEILLVIDGNTGQNALMQVKAFDAALNLTGLIVTKLDGTAKGGVLCALAAGAQGCRPIPVYWIGIGEQINDLQPFVASEFAKALVNE
jgi:fused signal recognition particle receptor